MEIIVAIESIARQAKDAAKQYTDVNDACPYPFHTEAGRTFKLMFEAALLEQQPAPTTQEAA
jgi:hypothetical protein